MPEKRHLPREINSSSSAFPMIQREKKKAAFPQVGEHLEFVSQGLLSVHSEGTTRELQRGLTTCFDRTESQRLCAAMPGPPRFTPPVCFPSPEQHRSYVPFFAQPSGNWGVRYNKKGD